MLGFDALGRAALGQITTAQALVNAPPTTLGGPIALKASIVAAAQPNPWVYLFHGGSQPFTPRKLAPQLSAVAVNNPPSTLGGPIAALAAVVAQQQPDPWVYTFFGAMQPFAPKKLSPGIPGQSNNPPPFAHLARSATIASIYHVQPNPWVYTFFGAMQPFAPKKLSPGIPGQSNNLPPFTLGGPTALKSQIVGQQQPDPWTYSFFGSTQPFAPRKLSPGIPGQDIDTPPFTHPSRSAAQRAIRTAWDPPPPDYQTVLYATIPEPQGGQTIVFDGSPATYTVTGTATPFLLTGWLASGTPSGAWTASGTPVDIWTPATPISPNWTIELTRSNR